MMSKIGGFVGGGGWKYAHGTAHYGRNFSLKWLKVMPTAQQKGCILDLIVGSESLCVHDLVISNALLLV